MREQLEVNLSSIVMNFKRLFDEADTARLIVTRKLKEIALHEKNNPFNAIPSHQVPHSSEKNTPKNSFSNTDDKAKMSSKAGEIRNFGGNQSKTPQKMAVFPDSANMTRGKPVQPERVLTGMFSLEDKIKKMRGNQNMLSKR